MKINPLSDRVVVKPEAAEEKTASGIILPDSAKEKPQMGEVVAVGPGKASDSGHIVKMTVKKGDKVLEIGTGSGYQASILAEMGVKVFSIERNKILHHRSKQLLSELGYRRIKCFFGDGYQGLPSFAPFNKIIVTAAAPAIPSKLKEQMKIGGIMIIPVGDEKKQIMYKIIRQSESNFEEIALDEFKFVPMLPGKNW